jgi:hypothetical protein
VEGEEERAAKAQMQMQDVGEGVQLAAYLPSLAGSQPDAKRKYYIRNG